MDTTLFPTFRFRADGAVVDPLAAPSAVGRALVLGGGGSTGNAWLIGVLAGLAHAGIDVTDADLVIGTSAGATAAAQIAGASLPDLLAATSAVPAHVQGAGPSAGRVAVSPVRGQLSELEAVIAASSDPADFRRRLGRTLLARDDDADGAGASRWRAIVARRLPRRDWPDRALLITAVDAATGRPVVLDAASGIDLVDAVAASTANGFGVPPARIGEHRLLDGGYRRNENADLAAGSARVLVLAPLGGASLHPAAWGTALDVQLADLRAGGSRVLAIVPDPSAERLFGANAMDAALRPAAARAGFARGRAASRTVADLWQ